MRMFLVLAVFLAGAPAAAQQADMSAFSMGPLFDDFGPVADIPDADFPIPDGAEFKVAFDVSEPAAEGKLNRTFESAARLVNMHQRAGVEPVKNRAVVVVHGRAVFDLLTDEAWTAAGRAGANPSGAPVREMIDQGVRFVVCGQSAAAYAVNKAELIPDVELAPSAMTAHALLQQQGYTVNPF